MGCEPRKIWWEERKDKNYWAKLHRLWNNSQIGYNGVGRGSLTKTKNDLTTIMEKRKHFLNKTIETVASPLMSLQTRKREEALLVYQPYFYGLPSKISFHVLCILSGHKREQPFSMMLNPPIPYSWPNTTCFSAAKLTRHF